MDFVRVAPARAGQPPGLVVGGAPFQLVLLNAFYLQEEAARGRLDVVEETLVKCARLGARVVRAWAFNDDPAKLEVAMQRGRLEYSEVGLAGVDLLLERARAHGLRLILPLVDYWSAYGGTRQWLRWNGVADARDGDARFFTDARVRDHYARHVERLLGRVNPRTGIAWGEDPVVLAWELMNEPRGRGLDGQGDALADWVAFAARAVKRHARQLVSVGDEGEEISTRGYDAEFWARAGVGYLFSPETGSSFSRHVEVPEVDLASCHFYPEKYGVVPSLQEEAGARWVAEHAAVAARAGKPLIVGELGLTNAGRWSLDERRRIYRRWFAAARAAGVAGIGLWLFAYDARPAAWDEFTFFWRSDGTDDGYADLILEAADCVGRPTLFGDADPSRGA